MIVTRRLLFSPMAPQTPSRRSKRGQPILAAHPTLAEDSLYTNSWSGQPIHVRPTDAPFDFLDDERSAWDDEDSDAKDQSLTFFYSGFERRKKKVAAYRRKGKNSTELGEPEATYSIGDTILVSTYTTSRHKIPSVAVILDMWEVRSEDEDTDGSDKMRIRVHWFIRPNEMATIRAKREYLDVRQLYLYFLASLMDLRTKYIIHWHRTMSSSQLL